MTAGLLFWTFAASTLVSLLFSTLAYALRSVSRVRLEAALAARRRQAALEAILSARYDLSLTAAVLRLITNALAIIAVGSYFLTAAEDHPNLWIIFGWTLLITVPSMLVFTVAIPLAWAKYAGEPLLALIWPVLRVVHIMAWPIIRVLTVFDEIVRRLAGVSLGEDADTEAEQLGQEILSVVAEGTAEGAVDEDQQKMIQGVISFRDLEVGQIMTPRTEIVAVDVTMPVLDVRDALLKDGLSRVPVYEGTLDNVVGILHAKDLLPFLNIAGGTATDDEKMEVRRLMRPPLFVPPTKPLRDLLREFRQQGVHMAVVLDEYGGTKGLVTTEDIVEQIVGDISDEYERPAPEELKRIDDRTVEVDARMPVAELNRAIESNFPVDGDFQTIGGFVIFTLEAIPEKGVKLKHQGIELTVIDAEPRRIKKLRLELPPRDAPAEPPIETSVVG